MKITDEIAKTVYLLRRIPQIDIERLSYELSEAEWFEFAREIDSGQMVPKSDLSYADSCLFMGITVRKRSAQGKGDVG
jgi:hypothetical protein